MSADRWSECPQCEADHAKEIAELQESVIAAYGKVNAEEWAAFNERSRKQLQEMTLRNSLREDWEIFIREGRLCVDYYAKCEDCGFTINFNHTEKLNIAK